MEFSSATYGASFNVRTCKSLKFQETGFKSKHSSRSYSSAVEARQQHNNEPIFTILSGSLIEVVLFSNQTQQVKVNIDGPCRGHWDDVSKVM